ncbi:MAG TPA: MFS transporter [Herpetosiphonaceae bacterium]
MEPVTTPITDEPPGHLPTLIASFLHFDLSFMLWVLLGALGISIAESLALSPAEKGIIVAIPILSGSLLRVPLGLLSDRIGGKRVGVAMLAFLFLPLSVGWLAGTSLPSVVITGLLLGTAGASFAVALPLASRWYPPQRQGIVLGIAAAGNSGTVVTNLAAPYLATIVGWHNVLGLAMIPLALVLIAFTWMAKDRPSPATGQPVRRYLAALKHRDLWWFCLFYSVTFGGYVGLSSFLPIFFRDQYNVDALTAGYVTALATFVGSLIRPLGGYLADRVGGTRMLSWVLIGIFGTYLLGAQLPSLPLMLLLLVIGMACLGMGNGAIFQLAPQRFARQIGITTGVIGAVGGIGGFLLPTILGSAKHISDSFSLGFLVLAAGALFAYGVLQVLTTVQRGWRMSWRLSPLTEAVADVHASEA